MTTRSNDRMEADLTGWLRGLEPGGTPVALRVRTFADLRDEAEHARPRFAWLRPTVSAVVSLGAVALVAGAIMVLSVTLGGASHGVGGPGQVGATGAGPVGPGDGVGQAVSVDSGAGQNPVALLLYLLAICLGGATVLVPRLRWAVGWMVGPAGEAAPGALLPFPRTLRSVPRPAWVMGVAAVAVGALILLNRQLNFVEPPGYSALDYVIGMYPQLAGLPLAVVVGLRYPMKDRASRFLLIGAGASLLGGLAFSLIDLRIRWLDWQVVAYASDVVNVVSVASVIGLAGRAGRVRKPPIWLAAAALGGAFALSYGSFFLNWFQFPTFIPDQQEIPGLIGDLAEWIAAAGAAGILWVGISTGRRSRGGWAWWLVLIGGALEMAAWSENGLGFLAQARILDMSLFESSVSWANLAGSIGTTALLFALAIGLRPVPPIGDAGSAVLDPDFPDEIGPHTAVAGETAGH